VRQTPALSSSVKNVLFAVVLVGGGTLIGLFVISGAQWQLRKSNARQEMAEMIAHELGPNNPPSAETFFPTEAVPRPPIVREFKIVSADRVGDRIRDEELVLALEIAGQARAYPLNVMTGPSREVFNDELGGRAIAATW